MSDIKFDYKFVKAKPHNRCRRHGKTKQLVGNTCNLTYLGDVCGLVIERHEPCYVFKKCLDCKKIFKMDVYAKTCPACWSVSMEYIDIPVKIGKLDKGFTKLKGDTEKQAYEWAEKRAKEGKLGRSHEPDGAPRNW